MLLAPLIAGGTRARGRATAREQAPCRHREDSALRIIKRVAALLTVAIFMALVTAFIGVSAGEPLGLAGTDLRINARSVDGRVQFALQSKVSGDEHNSTVYNEWTERRTPAKNKMPSGNEATGWLYSSPLWVFANGWTGPYNEARIAARRLADGRVEFGLQVRNLVMQQWSKIALPSARYLPADFDRARWLNSSPLNLAAIVPPVDNAVPLDARGVVRSADLDGYSWNGQEATLYYGTSTDPIYDEHNTWVVAVAATDDRLYDTIRLQVGCFGGDFGVWLWEESLPYAGSYDTVSVVYRFDDSNPINARWSSHEGSQDSVYPPVGSASVVSVERNEFTHALRMSSKLTIRISFYQKTLTATFDGLQGLWSTPVQRNLEACGRY